MNEIETLLKKVRADCDQHYRGPGKCVRPDYLRARLVYHNLLVRAGLLDPKLADVGWEKVDI